MCKQFEFFFNIIFKKQILTSRRVEVQCQSSPSVYTRVGQLHEDIDDEYDDMSLQLDLV